MARKLAIRGRRLFFWLCRRRQDSIQAQVHSGGAVVIGPASREDEGGHGPRALPAEKFDRVAQVAIVGVGESRRTIIEGRTNRSEEFVFRIGLTEFLGF